MHLLKRIGMTIAQLAKQAWRVPRTVGIAIKQKRGQALRSELEAERLDRIRNPSKYLGK